MLYISQFVPSLTKRNDFEEKRKFVSNETASTVSDKLRKKYAETTFLNIEISEDTFCWSKVGNTFSSLVQVRFLQNFPEIHELLMLYSWAPYACCCNAAAKINFGLNSSISVCLKDDRNM